MKLALGKIGLLTSLTLAGACGKDGTPNTSAVTFWQDIAPLYNGKCVRCHQQGGIAPFPLDNYTDAKNHAAMEVARVTEGTMPPYFMVNDGSCQSFDDDVTLSDAQKALIAAWVNGGLAEGTPATLPLPSKPVLPDAVDVTTPAFAPVAQGGALAASDEYRCFLLDAPTTAANPFLTGYAVDPGEASIVHHVLAFVVDPQAQGSSPGGQTNAALLQALDEASPDRLGWPCFGAAGEGVSVRGVPVTWAPGQGIVNYPDGMGFAIRPTDKLVVQIHYNLADPASAGKTDSTTLHLRFVPAVNRQLAFMLPDPFLDSLNKAKPASLPPGQADTPFTWMLTGAQVGVRVPSVDLVAVFPHMHGRGIRQTMQLGVGDNMACASHLEHWDFHWQEFYFYKTPPTITPTTQLKVTCEYDTSMDTSPVLPGWGTRNEMCLNVLMVALPAM